MREIDIINKFANEELKNGETFIYEINNSEMLRVKKVMISVDRSGDFLICNWLDSKDNIICKQWSLLKNNLTNGEYVKI